MARTIKFPLDMGNDDKVRTLEELREKFDAGRLVGHLVSGKLQTWLLDRHYKAELEAVERLDINDGNLVRELCRIFQTEQEPDDLEVNEILKNQRLQKEIKQFTDDEDILNHLDRVAVNQTQLDSLLEKKYSLIYLLGKRFKLNKDVSDVRICGINQPLLEIETDEVIDFESLHMEISKCKFDEAYNALQEQKKEEEENVYKRKKGTYRPSKEFDYMLSDDKRQKSEKLYDIIQKQFGGFEFDIDAGSKNIYEVLKNSNIQGIFDIDRFGIGIMRKIEKADLNVAWACFLNRIS